MFQAWAMRYSDEVAPTHPLSVSVQASRLIRRDCRRPLDVPDMATQLRVTRTAMARSFWRHFGMSMREYQALCRLCEVLKTIERDKVDAAAHEAGFRSRKNFYRGFRKVVGMTSRQYRLLPPRARSHIVDKMAVTLYRGVSNSARLP
jgi:AraC-like DNA-binding protein